jgi:hypothetical protein
MAISNINISNQPISGNRINTPPTTHTARKEQPKEDNGESTVVKISRHAMDLHKAETSEPSAEEHVQRIRALNRSDEMAQEKIQANAAQEAKALEAKQKIDAELYKRINTQA